MGQDTKIGWADDTVGFWWGCTERGPGCNACYARDGYPVSIAESQTGLPLWQSNAKDGTRAVRMHVQSAEKLMLSLNRKAQKAGKPRLVFINSQADTFEETKADIIRRLSPKEAKEKGYAYEIGYEFESRVKWFPPSANVGGLRKWTIRDERRRLFQSISECDYLRCLLLTKRPGNILKMWFWHAMTLAAWHPTVWLGTTIACQADADKGIAPLLKCRDLAPILFLSMEPLIEDVVLRDQLIDGLLYSWQHCIGWVIVGCESGPNRRPMKLDWARSLRDQCAVAGIPFFLKQIEVGGKVTDDINDFPSDLQVQQFPEL